MARAKRWVGPQTAGLNFHCPGCNQIHSIRTEPTGWGWNGDLERPTFTPSVLVRSGHHATGKAPGHCYCDAEQRTGKKPHWKCVVCHSFVTDGRIQFLSDCTHELAGQTVDLPELPEEGSV